MHDPNEPAPDAYLLPEPTIPEELDIALPKKKGWTRLSWLIILGLAALMAGRSSMTQNPAEVEQHERLEEIVFELQARYLIGAGNFAGNEKQLYEQARLLDKGSWGQRLRFIVLAGELAGPEEALQKAAGLQQEMQGGGASPKPVRLCGILHDLYRDYSAGIYLAPSVGEIDRAFLREQLGWFGELALQPRQDVPPPRELAAPAGAAPAIVLEPPQIDPAGREQVLAPAFTTLGVILGTGGGVCFLGVTGFVSLVIFIVLLTRRQLTGGLVCGSNHGGVYAETFALFFLLFIGLSFGLQALPWDIPLLVRASLVPLGSLAVLAWPVVRGIPWQQVRQEIGWTVGRNPSVEPALGLACYVMALPIVLVGLVVTLVLMAVRNQLVGLADNQPIHPIVEFIVHGTALDRVLVVLDACILAPIVEETMFRGVLYRHLRELSCRWSWLPSVLVSGTLVSFLFAVIHPQGLVAVPVLMALAYGFTIAREWRGSLIPAMTAHALNNGLVVLFVLLMMGG